jgi:hypothetical protein
MTYKIQISEENIVEVIHYSISIAEAEAARKEAAQIMKEKNLKLLLADLTPIESIHFSSVELFKFNKNHYDVLPAGTKIATVLRESISKEAIKFTENITSNRGIHFKVFSDYEKAKEWLLKNH